MNNNPNGFIKEDPWRIFRIMAEFVDSFETLSRIGPAVTIFGSARMKPTNPYFKAAEALAYGLAKNNLAVVTGGGLEEAALEAALAGDAAVGDAVERDTARHPEILHARQPLCHGSEM